MNERDRENEQTRESEQARGRRDSARKQEIKRANKRWRERVPGCVIIGDRE